MIKVISVESYDAMQDIIEQKTHTIEEQMQIIQMLQDEVMKQSCIIAGLKEMIKVNTDNYRKAGESTCSNASDLDFLNF